MALFDASGPRARRRTLITSLLAGIGVALIAALLVKRLAENGQFSADKWDPLFSGELIQFLAIGLMYTILAAVIGLALALPFGIVLAVGRRSTHGWLRLVCTTYVEFIRGTPVLLLVLFFFLAFPIMFHMDLPAIWSVVFALVMFNGAIICEIVRAGISALPTGQYEAASAIGMRRLQIVRIILLPQALRVMLPALIGQFAILIKDTSLGFVINYDELLTRSQSAGLLFSNPLQIYVVTAAVYIALNVTVSWLSQRISLRQSRRNKSTLPVPTQSEQERITVSSTIK
ncbi:amino acid ABC transporter permease [Pseudarthrobacter sp. AB1]|uniref:amino acid ABC transporter permease n=1 Tax=Pseudarthrobacter sp. AB1 TaxID=2138309 RepID=UPI00186B6EFA|nr:amino acid ABC transporter permease [Pseudarthrobacter sp. AB1]